MNELIKQLEGLKRHQPFVDGYRGDEFANMEEDEYGNWVDADEVKKIVEQMKALVIKEFKNSLTK